MPDMPAPPMPTMCTRSSSSGKAVCRRPPGSGVFTGETFVLPDGAPAARHLEGDLGHLLRGVAVAGHRRRGRHRRDPRGVAEQPGDGVGDERRA